jgi:hypothetical protein
MVTKYCVIRYLPHPLSGEMINIGVVVWRDGEIASQFTRNWNRARAFGREDISFLRDFVTQVEASAHGQGQLLPVGSQSLDAEQLEKITHDWSNSIQFSELRSSLRSPQEVIDEVSSIYLPELPIHSQQKGRTRHVAAMMALQRVSQVVIGERGPQASELVKREHIVKGKFDDISLTWSLRMGGHFWPRKDYRLKNRLRGRFRRMSMRQHGQ